jgi:Uma2 family endonuclease
MAGTLKLTYDDFLLFPDDGKRHELIDGQHYVTPSPNVRHQRISGRVARIIGGWLESHPLGELFFAPVDVVLTQFDVVVPDLLWLSNARASEILTEKHVTGAPEIVIEIASHETRTRDSSIKKGLYERTGVVEYWVVDPDIDVIRVYAREDGGFARARTLSGEAGEILTTPLLPGLEVPLSKVFETRKS